VSLLFLSVFKVSTFCQHASVQCMLILWHLYFTR